MCGHGVGCSKQDRRAVCCPIARITPQFKWEIFEDPPYNLEFVPTDDHLFIHPKQFLAGRSLTSYHGIKDDMQDWLKSLAAICFDEGNQNLVRRCDMCLDLHSDYVEKHLNAGTSMLQ